MPRKVLLVYPEFPPTYWSFRYTLPFMGKKVKDDKGKEEAKLGLLFVVRGDWLTKVDHKDHEIIEEAFKIRQKHNDPFDCFIFATARVQKVPLVTEDRVAREFLDDRLVMNWAGLKKNLKA